LFSFGTITDKESKKKYTNKTGIKMSSKRYTYSSKKKTKMAVFSSNAKDIDNLTVVFHIDSPLEYYITFKKVFTIRDKNTTIFV
jgi:hypothetical protein